LLQKATETLDQVCQYGVIIDKKHKSNKFDSDEERNYNEII